jgi:hypothetical protein
MEILYIVLSMIWNNISWEIFLRESCLMIHNFLSVALSSIRFKRTNRKEHLVVEKC